MRALQYGVLQSPASPTFSLNNTHTHTQHTSALWPIWSDHDKDGCIDSNTCMHTRRNTHKIAPSISPAPKQTYGICFVASCQNAEQTSSQTRTTRLECTPASTRARTHTHIQTEWVWVSERCVKHTPCCPSTSPTLPLHGEQHFLDGWVE